MSEDVKPSGAADSISEIAVEEFKYCKNCGTKNYANAEVCFSCERCSDFVDTFDEYEKIRQEKNAAEVKAMLEAERQKMEAEIRARIEQENAAKHTPTKEKTRSLEKEDEKNIDEWYDQGVSYDNARKYADAVKCYRKAAEKGHVLAQFCLGYCYGEGYGVRQDYFEAVKWYRKAAEKGNPDAQNRLGFCCYYGLGIARSDSEAIKWYRVAAEQGHMKAQFNLGICYENGYGVKQDYTEAITWYRKAAGQGLAEAKNELERLIKTGHK